MLFFIIKLRRSKAWWRVELIKNKLVHTYSFVWPLVFDWLKDVVKGRK